MENSDNQVYDSIAILLANRSFIYHLLQSIYADEPNRELMEVVLDNHTREALNLIAEDDDDFNNFYGLLDRLSSDMQKDAPETIDKLKTEYTYLMIGPAELVAPPWESVYILKEPLIFQESTLKVRQAYLEYDFLPAGYPNEADDHIALELHFMAHLARLALEYFEAGEYEKVISLLEDQKKFLIEHLLVWISDFAADMQKSKSHYFYPAVALLTEKVIIIDEKVLDEIILFLKSS
ncbi:MAG: molecular chaperone TorD family protein [Syntrophomonadaceae bacterium]|nr:molecular chaperone TorD family protein [Syntrophomonadaceae bacterium]